MLLPLEHSAFIIAVNVPELERRFRQLAEEISLVASHLADTEPELARLTKLRDEIAFAAENLKERSKSAEVQAAAAALLSACADLTGILFEFRQHHNGGLSALDEPHPLGRDRINDLRDEIAEDWPRIIQEEHERLSEIFKPLRGRTASLRDVMPDDVAAFYDLGQFFATAPDSAAALEPENRFRKIQGELTLRYRKLFERCCEVHSNLAPYVAESLDDERFRTAMHTQQQIVGQALKKLTGKPDVRPSSSLLNKTATVPQRHPYAGVKPPGHASGWGKLIKDGVKLYERRLDLPNDQALLLMRLILSRSRLNVVDLSEVDDFWKEQLDSDNDDEQLKRKNQIRTTLSKLRRSLCEKFAVPRDKQKDLINFGKTRPAAWELNWELLDEYALAKGEHTQE